ncbi:hypothetical protein HDV63DRAFT_82894 [Trichoderma sp. SZMC 28014]
MSSPGRDVPARAADHDSTTYLASSPSPSIASHRQRHPPFQPHQQTTASSSTAALQGQDQQHHYDANPSHSDIINDSNDAPAPSSSSDHIPPFEPIFTLLTNTTTNTTVHPRVHYLFSDDDASAVLTAPQTDPSHRALIVDLAPPANPTGKWTVSWASSLTPDFAVTASQLSLQQHSGNNDGEDGENNEGASSSVMLRVEGVEREAVPADTKPTSANLRGSSSSGGSTAGIIGREDVDQLTEEFRRRMGVLRKVVDEGERRRETLNRLNEEMAMTHPDGGDDNNTTTEDDTNVGGREPQ